MSFAQPTVMEGATTTLTVNFVNNGFINTIPANTMQVQISLPVTGEYVAFPESGAAVSGAGASLFTWTFLPATKTLRGVNTSVIGPGAGGFIVVAIKGFMSTNAQQVVSTANIIKTSPIFNFDNIANNGLDARLAVAAGGVVSVGLLDFNATGKDNKTVSLDWQTTSELNSDHFDVEYSTDGVTFSSIGKVAAAGTSTTARNYNLIHTKPINGINYYRLKQVDMDGTSKYSVIRKVKFGAASVLYAMPNPTKDRIRIISGAGGKVESVGIYTADGRKMQQINNYSYGSTIDMSSFAPATYMIRLTDKDGSVEILKIVKN
jgi:hypothetical protein